MYNNLHAPAAVSNGHVTRETGEEMSSRMEATVAADRAAPLEMRPEAFRALGHRLVDRIADYLSTLADRPVAPGEEPAEVRAALGGSGLPSRGEDPAALLDEAGDLLFEHSLFNGHPRFWGFVTSSAAPIGMLADLLASAVNPNVGGWVLAPIATEMEAQTVRWIAELLGFPPDCGGLLVSGGNMANMIGFWAARRAKLGPHVRSGGVPDSPRPRVYVSRETHTWIEKAADLSGMGTDAIRWIETDAELRIDTMALRAQIAEDQKAGDLPLLVVGTAGTVSTGAIDPLPELAAICRENGLWFHVDGAYGAPAVLVPGAPSDLRGIADADSMAIDPHKWLYAPLEAGCALVRDKDLLRDAFTYHPPYYPEQDHSAEAPLMYYEYGPQNSRGFRALKVWLAMRQAGTEGYARMIGEDIALARKLYEDAVLHPELEAFTQGLSITTFRFVPAGLDTAAAGAEEYLNELNRAIMEGIQQGGEAFVTNAVIDGRYLLRACIVNFRTTAADIAALPGIVARMGRSLDTELRPAPLR
jgi:glutamate/tyrosine decarboxylase-like PLP-dependent enzyme